MHLHQLTISSHRLSQDSRFSITTTLNHISNLTSSRNWHTLRHSSSTCNSLYQSLKTVSIQFLNRCKRLLRIAYQLINSQHSLMLLKAQTTNLFILLKYQQIFRHSTNLRLIKKTKTNSKWVSLAKFWV